MPLNVGELRARLGIDKKKADADLLVFKKKLVFLSKSIARVNRSLRAMNTRVRGASAPIKKLSNSYTSLDKRVVKTQKSIKKMGNEGVKQAKRIAKANKKLFDAKKAQQRQSGGSGLGGAGVASVAVGVGLVAGLKKAVQLSSDFEETTNVIEVGFKSMAASAEQWAERMADAQGRSRQEMRAMVGDMQLMLSNMVGSASGADKMSKKLTELAVDLASLKNVSDEVAFRSIISGMTGMILPMRKFGVNMSVNALEAFNLSKGIDKAFDSMSEAERTQTRFNFIMEHTTNAQGDAIRTAGSYANQVKRLSGNFKDLATVLGNELRPELAKMLVGINENLTGFKDLRPWVLKTGVQIGIVSTAMLVLIPLLVKGFGMLKKWRLGLIALNAPMKATFVLGMKSAIAGLASFVVAAWPVVLVVAVLAGIFFKLRSAFRLMSDDMKKTSVHLAVAFTDALGTMIRSTGRLLKALGTLKGSPAMKAMGNLMMNQASLRDEIDKNLKVIGKDFDSATGEELGHAISGGLTEGFKGAVDIIGEEFKDLFFDLRKDVESILDPITELKIKRADEKKSKEADEKQSAAEKRKAAIERAKEAARIQKETADKIRQDQMKAAIAHIQKWHDLADNITSVDGDAELIVKDLNLPDTVRNVKVGTGGLDKLGGGLSGLMHGPAMLMDKVAEGGGLFGSIGGTLGGGLGAITDGGGVFGGIGGMVGGIGGAGNPLMGAAGQMIGQAMDDLVKGVTEALGDIFGNAVPENLQNAIGGFFDDLFKPGGLILAPTMGLQKAFLSLAEGSERHRIFQEKLSAVNQGLAEAASGAIGMIEPMVGAMAMLVDILTPLIQVMVKTRGATEFMIEVLKGASAFILVWQKNLLMASMALNRFIEAVTMDKGGKKRLDTELKELAAQVELVKHALAEVGRINLDSATKAFKNIDVAAEDAASSLRELSSSATNLPAGYRIQGAQYQSTQAALPSLQPNLTKGGVSIFINIEKAGSGSGSEFIQEIEEIADNVLYSGNNSSIIARWQSGRG